MQHQYRLSINALTAAALRQDGPSSLFRGGPQAAKATEVYHNLILRRDAEAHARPVAIFCLSHTI